MLCLTHIDSGIIGVFGKSGSDELPEPFGAGVLGKSESQGGVRGESVRGVGVWGICPRGFGVKGETEGAIGVWGISESEDSYAVSGDSLYGTGVSGSTYDADGVADSSLWGVGVHGITGVTGEGGFSGKMSDRPIGVRGESSDGIGVDGLSNNFMGVEGISLNFIGMYGETFGADQQGVLGITTNSKAIGVAGTNTGGGLAGLFTGDVHVKGNVHVTGNINKSAVTFKIDHPLDAANKYLYHSSVESPDMKNIYDGVVALDDKGEAEIELPDWFGALNKDFRYQLTAIGAPGPNLYIAEEISKATTSTANYSDGSSSNNNNSHFKIAGGTSGMKVSWQVTGIRDDPYAKAHPIQIEEDKPDEERGYYIHPDLYGQAAEKQIGHLPFPKDRREEVVRAAHK